MSQYVAQRALVRNNPSNFPDLFSWRQPVMLAPSRAAQKLALRYGISIAHAATVATLAGLGSAVER